MRLLHINRSEPPFATAAEALERQHRSPRLRRAVIGFTLSGAAILVVAPFLMESSEELANQRGLSGAFIGMVPVASTTSLPKVAGGIAAVRSGSYDLAVGNILESN